MEMTSKVRETWEQEVTVLKDEIVKLGNILEAAWGVIANAGGGNWEIETKDWQEAAARWRDNYHTQALMIGANYNEKIEVSERIIASEALFGFAAWMTCRTQALMIGANYDAAPVADLVKKWCDANGLPEPRDGIYAKNIKQPKAEL